MSYESRTSSRAIDSQPSPSDGQPVHDHVLARPIPCIANCVSVQIFGVVTGKPRESRRFLRRSAFPVRTFGKFSLHTKTFAGICREIRQSAARSRLSTPPSNQRRWLKILQSFAGQSTKARLHSRASNDAPWSAGCETRQRRWIVTAGASARGASATLSCRLRRSYRAASPVRLKRETQ